MTLHRKNPRLSAKNYLGNYAYFITICCDRRRPYLASTQRAERTIQILIACAARHAFRLHAYCIMPDHVHFLAEGMRNDSNLQAFVRLYKQRSGFEFKKRDGKALWEMSYYDHILRNGESVEEVATYIWWNPVRKHLCAEPGEFPFRVLKPSIG